jgi:hypothetical protein
MNKSIKASLGKYSNMGLYSLCEMGLLGSGGLRIMRLSPKCLWRKGFFVIEVMLTGALVAYMDVST